eukprot:TRINITY_DN64247_c0_g1_i1.p1 TRINITY_DN64247_c0_g1~~TRINITY_DN64247_c0_g1_i1.p1  ORF type:complete len:1237 (+),score=242.42 TRINITY_DN64247_c0_g1_i1:65-3775(+)
MALPSPQRRRRSVSRAQSTGARSAGGRLRISLVGNRLSLGRLLEILDVLPTDKVEVLNAAQNELGDEAPKALFRRLPRLRRLSVSCCGVGANGLRALAAELKACGTDSIASGLQALDVSGNCIEGAILDLGAVLSAPDCTLLDLDLSFCVIGAETLRAFFGQLRSNSTLQALRLEHCRLQESASALLEALTDADCKMPLTRLSLARNALTESAYGALNAFMDSSVGRRLTDLDVSGNSLSEEANSRALGCALVPGAAPQATARNGQGTQLFLDAAMLPKMSLNLSGMRLFFDPSFRRWDAKLHALTALRNPMSRVDHVLLDACTFTEAAMPTLARICLNVRVFSLCSQPLGELFAHSLADAARGAEQRRGSGEDGTPGSPQKPSGGGVIAVVSPTATRNNGPLRLCLRELRLNDSALQDAGAASLVEALAKLRNARRDGCDVAVLELAGNHFSNEVVNSLAQQITNNAFLERLVLSRNRLRQVGGDRLRELLLARSPACAPLDLRLRSCGLTAEGVLQVWTGVLEGRVRHVDLAENSVDSACIGVLRAKLQSVAQAAPSTQQQQRQVAPTGLVVSPFRRASNIMSPRSRRSSTIADDLILAAAGATSPGKATSPRTPGFENVSSPVNGHGSGASEAKPLGCMSVLSSVCLLPNPCSGADVADLLIESAPWQQASLTGASLDAPTVAQLLHCLGSDERSGEEPPPRLGSKEDAAAFSLTLVGSQSFARCWQGGLATVADALKYALAPPSLRGRELGQVSPSWNRSGGCLGGLLLDMDKCDFNCSPNTMLGGMVAATPEDESSVRAIQSSTASLAKLARREVQRSQKEAAYSPRQSRGTHLVQSASATSTAVADLPEAAAGGGRGGVGAAAPVTPSRAYAASAAASAASASSCARGPLRNSPSIGSTARAVDRAQPGAEEPPQASLSRSSSTPTSSAPGRRLTGSAARLCAADASVTNGAYSDAAVSLGDGYCFGVAGSQHMPDIAADAWLPAGQCIGAVFERFGQAGIDVSAVQRQLRGLEQLRLVQCRLQDGQLAQLCHSGVAAKWGSLRLLDLRDNQLTATCCAAIAAAVAGGQLEVLVLDGNSIQAQGLRVLCASIKPGARPLRWLSVADNDVRHPGGTLAAGMLAAAGGCPLRGLSLARNPRLSCGELAEVLRGAAKQEEVGTKLELLDISGSCADSTLCQQMMRTLTQCAGLVVDVRTTALASAVAAASAPTAAGLPADVAMLGQERRLLSV